MNVLVYSGTGTTTESVKHCIESLRFHLSPYYAVVTINETSILNDPWMYKTSMLVIPGGADLPYCNVLNGEGNRKILSFIKKGGKFLGLCAGGYYGSSFVEWEKGTPREVSGRRELGLFQGTAKGCTFSGFEYNSHVGARIVPLEVNTDVLAECPSTVYNYYNGGGTFLNASRVKNCTVLARYVDPEVGDDDNAAVVLCQVGKGTALLSGTHPEFSSWLMKPGAEESHYRDIAHQLSAHDTSRKVFLKQCLEQLGLKVNNDVNAPLIPKLSPIFIASNNPFNTKKLADDLAHNLELVDGNKYEDDNDTLVFHRQSTGLNYLNDSPDDDDVNHIPKHINFCDEGLPDAKTTPFFNMKTYFAHMNNYNSSSSSSNHNGPIGSILAYGEVVTSTNTMLDKNPRWLARLPHGLVFTATSQVAGRGRGGNVWVNPRGVMATSVLFRMPAGVDVSSRVVTLQYLCSIALIESMLGYGQSEPGQGVGYEDMPVRLKWPNDIYILKPEYFNKVADKDDLSNTVDGDDNKWVKVCGALVNSSYIDGQFNLVWGAGVNVANDAPTTSLNMVLARLNEMRKHAGKPELPPYQMEVFLATIMKNLNSFYDVFMRSGLRPFLPLYYKRWFHTNQTVLLQKESISAKVVIKGITDQGLLMAEDVATKTVYDLQPDGNSFDIFKGLVYTKH